MHCVIYRVTRVNLSSQSVCVISISDNYIRVKRKTYKKGSPVTLMIVQVYGIAHIDIHVIYCSLFGLHISASFPWQRFHKKSTPLKDRCKWTRGKTTAAKAKCSGKPRCFQGNREFGYFFFKWMIIRKMFQTWICLHALSTGNII